MITKKSSIIKSLNFPETWPIKLPNSDWLSNCHNKMPKLLPISNNNSKKLSKFYKSASKDRKEQNKKYKL